MRSISQNAFRRIAAEAKRGGVTLEEEDKWKKKL